MNKVITEEVTDNICTGCGACANICPTQAITMQENEEGFIIPVLEHGWCHNCGQCVAICPVLKERPDNHPQPELYAFRAEDSIRALSSSGGVFTVLADAFLAQHSYICGVVLDDDLNARHVLSNSPEDVRSMRGAKYVQSSTNLIFRQIREKLEENQSLLFTGTPCQVAGLRLFLQKDYENLYCVDLLCHGVPSNFLFKKHINEISKNNTIKHISFRDKRYGWTSTLRVELENNSCYEGIEVCDAFLKAFHSGLSLRKSCYNCSFCIFPRPGDLSIGDFWWYENIPGGDRENKGTSIILKNREKGERLLEILKNSSGILHKHNYDVTKIWNRINPEISRPESRERFFSYLQHHTLDFAMWHATARKYDVGIVGTYRNDNIGGFLTYYALYKFVSDLGYSVLMIDRPANAERKYRAIEEFNDFNPYPKENVAMQYANLEEMRVLSDYCSTFIVGSDLMFNPFLYESWGKFVRLDWVADNKKKVSYASSFGCDRLNNNDILSEIAYFLKKFDAVSVREKNSLAICQTQLGVKATHVLDPVFLCDTKNYDALIGHNAKPFPEKFIHAYIVNPNDDAQKIIEDIHIKYQLPYFLYTHIWLNDVFYLTQSYANLNKRLQAMRDCAFTITDSYHGVCFSLIFKNNFIAICKPGIPDSRIITLLEAVGLQNRIVTSYGEFCNKRDSLLSDIDYDAVEAKLMPLMDKSRAWLVNELRQIKYKPFSDYDMLTEKCHKLEEKFNEMLRAQEEKFNKELDKLRSQIRHGHEHE